VRTSLHSLTLPTYLCQRLARLAMQGSPPAAALGLALTFNVLLRPQHAQHARPLTQSS
jgi:hypothetical protein